MPNVYTTLEEVDLFADPMGEAIRPRRGRSVNWAPLANCVRRPVGSSSKCPSP